MAEYYDALKSAVTNLKSPDRRARHAFYDRARKLVLERLQTVEPVMAAEDLRAEMMEFDAAVRQIEQELLPPAPAAPVAPPASAPRRAAPRVRIDRTALQEHSAGIPPEEDVEARPPQRSYLAKNGVLIGLAALLIIGAIAYAFWPQHEPERRTDRTPPVAARPENPPASRPEPASKPEPAASNAENLPYILRRQLVFYRTVQTPGTIVISKSQHFIYVVKPNSAAMRYTFAMGPDCLDLMGLYPVSRKDGAPDTALTLGDAKCRIRPVDAANVLGQNTRTPGFQLARDDFVDLFDHTDVDARVVVTN